MEKYEKMLNMLMNINKLIRFAAVCDKDGNILWHSQRDDVKNIIPLSDTKKSIKRAAEAWHERETIVQKAGRGMYAIAAYEKIKRITIPLDKDRILFISTDNRPKHEGEYGVLAGIGAIMSIVDFVNSSN
jgi:hypothetical protein